MIKKMVLLFVLCLALPCAAQRHLIKEVAGGGAVRQALGKNAGQNLLRNARVVQGKIILNNTRPNVQLSSTLEKYIFKNIPPTDFQRLPIVLYEPSFKQRTDITLLYMRTMSQFQDFKREMDALLYYQSKPNERRDIAVSEQAYWNEKINAMNSKLNKLKNLISPKDPAYQAAQEYMIFAAETINPMLRGMLGKHEFKRMDRQYVQEEFFMHTPNEKHKGKWTAWMPSFLNFSKTSVKLPPGLKMAVLNDRRSVLSAMEQAHKTSFCPDWTLFTYDDTEALLKDIYRGAKFDIILTDIIVPGGGGYYLVSELRDRGFNGVILGLSAYSEDNGMGLSMFRRGFDGMIPVPVGFEHTSSWQMDIMKKMQNYFYYRDANGWKR